MAVIFKARIEGDWHDEDGIRITSYANRLIPFGLLRALNYAVHDVVRTYNGQNYWRETFIKFTDRDGTRYEQFGKETETPCKQCVFYGGDKPCRHPHYYDGSKGYCGKPYRIAKED